MWSPHRPEPEAHQIIVVMTRRGQRPMALVTQGGGGKPPQFSMHLPKQQKTRRGGRNGLKWALIWAAVALIAAPVIGTFIEKQGR